MLVNDISVRRTV